MRRFFRKYWLYITIIGLFLVLIVFFDQYSLIKQIKLTRTLREREREEQYYTTKIEEERALLEGMHNDTAIIEQIARERYLMKKDNEVIYIIETCPEKKQHSFANPQ